MSLKVDGFEIKDEERTPCEVWTRKPICALKTCLNGENLGKDNSVLNGERSPKCLTTSPDECKGVGSKPMTPETARHTKYGRYSLF